MGLEKCLGFLLLWRFETLDLERASRIGVIGPGTLRLQGECRVSLEHDMEVNSGNFHVASTHDFQKLKGVKKWIA